MINIMYNKNKNFNSLIKKRYILCFSLAIFYLLPLLLSGHYYADDLLHSMVGKTPWISNGRPLSDALLHLLMAGGLLNDIAPLTQIGGAAILSACIVIVSVRISKDGILLPIVALFPLICSPFFLENWSFRYDSLAMACASAAAIIPYAVKSNSIIKTAAISCIMLFVSLCFYQAAINEYIAFSAIFFIIDVFYGRDEGRYRELAGRVFGLILANAIYSITVKKFMVNGEYNIIHSRLVSGGIHNIFDVVFRNYIRLSDMLFSAFSGVLKIYFIVPVIAVAIFIFVVLFKVFSRGNITIYKIYDVIIIFSGVIVIYCSAYGPLLLLQNPVFSPRVLVGASATLSFITVSTYLLTKNNFVARWINFMPIIGMFILAYSYYNAQRTTDELELNMISEIKTSIALSGNGIKGIAFRGSAPHSLQSKIAENNFPIIGRIIFNDLNQDFLWGQLKLKSYGLQVPYLPISNINSDICQMPISQKFGLYNIRTKNNFMVVDYGINDCK